jgi:hypothetical protein
MSDEALRAAERRAVVGGVEDQARALVERLRRAPACERCDSSTYGAGTLRVATTTAALIACPSCAGTGYPLRARVELAAYCGDEAARLVVDPGHEFGTYFHLPPTPDRPHGIHGDGVRFDEFVGDLSRWADVGPAPGWILVRAAVAAARVALPKYMADAHGLGIDAHGRLYELDPGEWVSRASLNEAMLPVVLAPLRAIEATEAVLVGKKDRHEARDEIGEVVLAAGLRVYDAWWRQLRNLLLLDECLDAPGCLRDAVESAARLAGEGPVRDAIRRELVAWALA